MVLVHPVVGSPLVVVHRVLAVAGSQMVVGNLEVAEGMGLKRMTKNGEVKTKKILEVFLGNKATTSSENAHLSRRWYF